MTQKSGREGSGPTGPLWREQFGNKQFNWAHHKDSKGRLSLYKLSVLQPCRILPGNKICIHFITKFGYELESRSSVRSSELKERSKFITAETMCEVFHSPRGHWRQTMRILRMINIKRWIVFVGRTALRGGGPLQAPHNGREGRGGGRGVINYICQQTPTTATVVTLTTRYPTPGSRINTVGRCCQAEAGHREISMQCKQRMIQKTTDH